MIDKQPKNKELSA